MSGEFKRCGCGRTYDAAAWLKLPLVGIQPIPGYCSLELRNCSCRSTLAVELPMVEAELASVTELGA